MITLHFHLQPQYKYELFHINFININLPPLMPDEDYNFGGSLILDFRK